MSTEIATEERIIDLCRQAKAKGWEFSAYSELDTTTKKENCGCALEACAFVFGDGDWTRAGSNLGMHVSSWFGIGFDEVMTNEAPRHLSDGELSGHASDTYLLGRSVALRLRAEGLA